MLNKLYLVRVVIIAFLVLQCSMLTECKKHTKQDPSLSSPSSTSMTTTTTVTDENADNELTTTKINHFLHQHLKHTDSVDATSTVAVVEVVEEDTSTIPPRQRTTTTTTSSELIIEQPTTLRPEGKKNHTRKSQKITKHAKHVKLHHIHNISLVANKSMVRNESNQTETKLSLIDSINQGFKANEPSLTIGLIVGACVISIIICGCLLKVCYPKDSSTSLHDEMKKTHDNINEHLNSTSEHTPVLNYSRTQQKNIEKFY
jgi:hypothetical protein